MGVSQAWFTQPFSSLEPVCAGFELKDSTKSAGECQPCRQRATLFSFLIEIPPWCLRWGSHDTALSQSCAKWEWPFLINSASRFHILVYLTWRIVSSCWPKHRTKSRVEPARCSLAAPHRKHLSRSRCRVLLWHAKHYRMTRCGPMAFRTISVKKKTVMRVLCMYVD